MTIDDIRCGPISEASRTQMATVIESAFAPNLRSVLPDPARRLRVLHAGIDLGAAIGAYRHDVLVGVVGLKSMSVSVFDGMTFGMLLHEIGGGALKAKLALKLLDRSIEPGTMRIEFLAVDESVRGAGVGSALLRAVEQRACADGANLLELSVEPENSSARRLYSREGFCDAATDRDSAPRRWLLNESDIRMIKEPRCTTS
jgi:ribosomal protein S18 acetylase RimI-like enzyme